MGNLNFNLPLPAGNGAGAAVDTSDMGQTKTLVASGNFGRATVTIEASVDGGVTFEAVTTFQTGITNRVVDVACTHMRTFVRGRQGAFTANLDVGANDGGMQNASLPLPVGVGAGASVDVTSLGTFCTFIVDGTFLGAAVQIQISEDGVDWATAVEFASRGGLINKSVTAQFMRTFVVGRPVSGVTAAVGAANDSLTANSALFGYHLYFAPAHPDGPGQNRFLTWQSLNDAIQSLRNGSLTKVGEIVVDFDLQYIGGEFQVPNGTWDMSYVRWQNSLKGPFTTPRLTFADDAHITSVTALLIEGYGGFSLVNDSLVNTPFVLKDFFGIAMIGKRSEMFSRVPGAAPLVKADPTAAFCFIFGNPNFAGSIGNGVVNPSPVIDCAGRFFFLGLPGSGLDDNTLTDSVGTGVFDMSVRGFMSAGRNGSGTWRMSGLPATTAIIYEQDAHMRHSLTVRGPRPLGTTFVTRVPVRQTPYVMSTNEVALVDTDFIGTPIAAMMTFVAATSTISGADFSRIKKGAKFTVAGTVSNNGVKTAATDGTTTQVTTVEALIDEGPVAATVTITTAEVILPVATPLSRGTIAVVKAISDSSACALNILPMTQAFVALNALPAMIHNLATPTDEGTITAISVDGLTITVDLDAGAPALNAFAGQILVFPNGSFGDANAQQVARRLIATNTAADPSDIVIAAGALTAAQQAALVGARVQIRAIGADDKLDGGAGPMIITQATVDKASGVEFVSDGVQVDNIGTWWSH